MLHAAPKAALILRFFSICRSLRKKCLPRPSLTSAAEADIGNKRLIAAVNRCATQNQVQQPVCPQPAKRCLDTKTLLRSQRGQYVLAGCVPGGGEAAQQAHDQGKNHRRYRDRPCQVQTENGFAEGERVADTGGHAVERQD